MKKASENPPGSRQKGKIAEFYVISRLIAREIDVYAPILDIGVDCIARVRKEGKPNEYYDFQIKGARLGSNISIRNAKKIIEYVKATREVCEKNLERFFLILPLRKNGDYEEIICLDAQR